MIKVLIADDRATTRYMLKKNISEWGYEVIEAIDGNEAWTILQSKPNPRIAILDWVMPGMDGVEICKKLQNDHTLPFIYTILLTSKKEREDLVYALENGAHNFQSKPFSPAELRSHLNVAKRLVESDDQLKEYAAHMEQLAEIRAKQLIHADRLATLGTLAAGITHEISSPITYVAANTEVATKHWRKVCHFIQEKLLLDPRQNETIGSSFKKIDKSLDRISNGTFRIMKIVRGIGSFSRKEHSQKEKLNIHECINVALQLCQNQLKYNISVKTSYAKELPPVLGNTHQIEQVLVNLIANAVHAMSESNSGALNITTTVDNNSIVVAIKDSGPGIPSDILDNIWDPFFTTKPEEKGTGLGLSICKEIITKHDGCIWVENNAGKGACFKIALPVFKDN
ncbi:MAG: Response regulator receiver sensor signal transduction histidine kinase [Candidatus Magnetoglobus multicellularis str. Araruama]|uniref:histidine kinase n=1 Tax=Candidatus Magnetoglobus multicellularis str. Araruama TaxID=890399 RepID=A0A1V1PDL9_9BACT|nr:MAG: Response regulator receiver sensor signal transduction histidine kinase [Candidatus Magnetoglobus multicellularis str. Araruama]